MKTPPFSPWAMASECVSPDGRYVATIPEAQEVAMGAPTAGSLFVREASEDLSEAYEFSGSFSPSFVWASDSSRIAIPRWTRDRHQDLCIVDVEAREVELVLGHDSVLELHSFEGAIIRGIRSPAYRPSELIVRLLEHE